MNRDKTMKNIFKDVFFLKLLFYMCIIIAIELDNFNIQIKGQEIN